MSAPATNPLEGLLTEALHARAELVDAHDLTPAAPPAVVVPLHRRGPVVAAVVTAGLVAAAAVVAVAVTSDAPSARGDKDFASPSASSAPSDGPSAPPTTPVTGADGLFEETDLGYVDPGTTVTGDDGSTAVVSADSTTLTVTDDRGTSYTADLDVADDGSPNRLSSQTLGLGQAGNGWLVRSGDEHADLTVLVLRSGDLVAATEPASVPFGNGYTADDQGYLTWLNDGVLRTRLSIGTPDEGRYDVYDWEVTGPGEGGGGPDSDAVDLVPTRQGTYCIADGVATACPSDPFDGVDDAPELPAQDQVDTVAPGEQVSYPGGDGWTAELVPSGAGFALLVDGDTSPLQVDVPGAVDPTLDTQLLRYGSSTGWLIRDELGGGDSTRYTVVSFAGGDLVVDEYDGQVPFGSGFTSDSGVTGRYETFTAGGGKGLYTRVYPDMEKNDALVYSWTLDSEDSTFRPTLLGRTCVDRTTAQAC
ncbi:hypothetical protein [Nocardioides plantarum]|uniref:Uncharacterized protein n=1 Tax=Nocardioides plantarum TaxID=29299 RepID=A0ABV5KFH1_9ACTN|nr:hypothetical protein [Nocardioides plantarum]